MPKILAVEDNPAILDFYREFFGDAGFEVETAEDAFSAINKFQAFRPDVIILDLDIPAGGGMMVFETLRTRFNSPVPVIFSTGKPEKLPRLDNLHNASSLGKPADPEVLMAAIVKITGLPAQPAAAKVSADPGMAPPPPPPSAARPAAAARILVVDDDPAILELYCELLAKAGYEVQRAEDAMGAVARFQEFKPALIILDVDMPAGGGKKVFERLRVQLASPAPIIFSTGAPESVQALEKNMNVAVLKKPVAPALLLEMIKKLLKTA
jgi:DNA-binding response OmpR family regulator